MAEGRERRRRATAARSESCHREAWCAVPDGATCLKRKAGFAETVCHPFNDKCDLPKFGMTRLVIQWMTKRGEEPVLRP